MAVKRKDWHKFHKLGMKIKSKRKWRKARGRHNKIRKSKRGHAGKPKIGYKSAWYERPLAIENIAQLHGADKSKTYIIASRTGGKKRAEIISKAKSMGINVMNPRMEKKSEENKK